MTELGKSTVAPDVQSAVGAPKPALGASECWTVGAPRNRNVPADI